MRQVDVTFFEFLFQERLNIFFGGKIVFLSAPF